MSNEELKEAKETIQEIEKKNKPDFKKWFIQYLWISVGVIFVTLGYYFFFDPAHIIAGGVTGLAIFLKPLWANSSWFTSSIFLYGIEAICLLLGLIFIGKDFFLKTIYASLLYPSLVFILERINIPGDAPLQMVIFNSIDPENRKLICLFLGALLTGGGVGIALRNNGSTGGIDVIQKMISKYAKIPLCQTMYFTDCVIVVFAGLRFNPFSYSIELVVYGSIAVIVEGFIIDYIALSIKPRRTVYVISDNPQSIKDLIYSELDRGVTFSPVMGAYTNKERTMVICTMDKNEAYRIVCMISKVDPKAFTFVTSCKEVRGEYDKRGIF
jgi:uncharacterized membrane-anchored protein YitT (DUF2179 family)